MSNSNVSPSLRSIRGHLLAAALVGGVLVLGVAGWARTTELAGAVISSGVVVVDSNVKKVQHPNGGIVRELLVHDDQLVHSGDLLVRLDDTQTKANLGVITANLDELRARQARQEADRRVRSPSRFRATCSSARPQI